jgi:hypothetical protein
MRWHCGVGAGIGNEKRSMADMERRGLSTCFLIREQACPIFLPVMWTNLANALALVFTLFLFVQ